MKFKFFISILLLVIIVGQDRSTLFATSDDEPNPDLGGYTIQYTCLLYTSPSPRD